MRWTAFDLIDRSDNWIATILKKLRMLICDALTGNPEQRRPLENTKCRASNDNRNYLWTETTKTHVQLRHSQCLLHPVLRVGPNRTNYT